MSNDTYPLTIDHSQDIQIHRDKNGNMFAIKNIRQEFEGNTMIFIADIAGNEKAAKDYLKALAEV